MGVGSVNWGREGEGETKRKREEGLIPSEFIFNRISYCFGDKNRINIRPR